MANNIKIGKSGMTNPGIRNPESGGVPDTSKVVRGTVRSAD
jgi:hypothetical protein